MAKLTQKQVEDWIAKNGGSDGVQYSVEQKQIKNPDSGSPDPYVNIEVEVWRNSKTGAELSARRGDDGDYEQIEAKNADPNKPSAGTTEVTRAAEAKAKREREESEANAALPAGQDPRYETNEARAKRAQETIDRQGKDAKEAAAASGAGKPRQSRVNPADPTKTQEFDPAANNGQGGWVDAGPNAAGVQAAEDRNKPKPEKAADGSYGYWDTTQKPPKWVPISNAPGAAPPTPVQINGRWGVWKPGANGGAPTWEPSANQPGATKLPADAPKLDLTNAQTARTSFMALMSYVDNMRRNGQLTAEEAKDILAIPHSQVTDIIGQETAATTQENTVRDDRLAQNRDRESQRSNRATESGNMFSNAAKAAGEPGAVRGDLIPSYLQAQARMGQASGANNIQPEVDIPGAIGIRPPARPTSELGQPGDPPMTGGPLPKPLLAPAPPVSAAQGAAVAAGGRAAAAGGTPTAGETGGPPLAPGPVAPTPAAIAPATPLPTQAQGLYPSVNPITGEPTGITPPAAQAADGNESDDDILTVFRPREGDTVQMTRAQYNEQMRLYPHLAQQTSVVNAQPNPSGMPAAPTTNMKPDSGPSAIPQENLVPDGRTPAWQQPQPPQPGEASGGGNVQMAPQDQVGAVASYSGPASMHERDDQFIGEGFSPEEIEEAKRRVLARYGGMRGAA